MDNASRLIRLRRKIGLSQTEMAVEFGVSRSTLSYWESGRNPIPRTALKLIEIYEEYVDEDLALKRHEDIIRKLSIGWGRRLMSSFASGARKKNRKRIEEGLEKSLYSFFRHELSPHRVKRNLQVSIFNRMVDAASRSKGLPMKLVQVMSFLNPEMNQDAREALEQIHNLQCPMAPTLVARILHEEFGESPSKLFAEWSPKPFATASIGQVHLARLHSGEKVAVKVQYPDVQKSLERDLASLGFFGEMVSVFNPEVRSVIAKLQEAILHEADYGREKEFLDTFHDMYAKSPNIIIPKSYSKYCSSRVLTMDYIEGLTIDQFRSAPYEERRRAAETLAAFVTGSAFKAGIMNTDTNAGNFIFCPHGKVGFIDFGRASKLEIKNLSQLLTAVIKKDAESAKSFLPQMFAVKAKAGRDASFPFEEIWGFFLSQQKHLHSGEFRFTRESIAQSMSEARRFPLKKEMQLSMETIWSLATSLGLWNVLADLDVSVDYGKISLDVLVGSPAIH